jgi:predicted NUDIX family NTP pyrophosphohydrolase
MPLRSAGLLFHRGEGDGLEVLLVHPGGPFWKNKDGGAWSIPKGLVEPGEDELAAARRETREELGIDIGGECSPLGEYRQPGGKIVVVWSVATEPGLEIGDVRSSLFEIEWPPKSGRLRSFPEVDRAGWFTIAEAQTKMLKGQRPMLQDLMSHLTATGEAAKAR